MIDRLKRISTAASTLDIIEKKHYTNRHGKRVDIGTDLQSAIENTQLCKGNDFAAVFNERDRLLLNWKETSTVFEITQETTLQAAERLSQEHDKVYCLNFASAKKPGGGFLNGSQAQEESLARSSALYPCIVQMTEMYEANKRLKTCLYNDDMIYSPKVPVFRKDNGDLLDHYYQTSFLTAPAVNAGVIREQEPENVLKIEGVMKDRLEKILSLAIVKGYRVLLLGAWGCGVFRNDPNEVAAYFKYHLVENPVFKDRFDRVVFAIYGSEKENLQPFLRLNTGRHRG